jgi:hypothetical protein
MTPERFPPLSEFSGDNTIIPHDYKFSTALSPPAKPTIQASPRNFVHFADKSQSAPENLSYVKPLRTLPTIRYRSVKTKN